MSFRRVCVAVLAVQAWSAVWARPSEGTAAPAGGDVARRDALLAACPDRPNVLSTPEEMVGEWCEPEHLVRTENGLEPPQTCERLTVTAVGNGLGMTLNVLSGGRILGTKRSNLTRDVMDTWQSNRGDRTKNVFLGLSADSRFLHMCVVDMVVTVTPEPGTVPDHITLARCLNPGEEATGNRPRVLRCDLPQST